MQQPFENPEAQQTKAKSSRLTIAIAVVVAAAILISLWFLFEPLKNRRATSLQETVALRMNPAEQEYAKKIEIGNIAMSRAENFLHQEVTTLTGELYNGGSQRVLGLVLTTEFSDDMNQIVLRETRRCPLANGATLKFRSNTFLIPGTCKPRRSASHGCSSIRRNRRHDNYIVKL
jgi:hypothetical protein